MTSALPGRKSIMQCETRALSSPVPSSHVSARLHPPIFVLLLIGRHGFVDAGSPEKERGSPALPSGPGSGRRPVPSGVLGTALSCGRFPHRGTSKYDAMPGRGKFHYRTAAAHRPCFQGKCSQVVPPQASPGPGGGAHCTRRLWTNRIRRECGLPPCRASRL